MKRHVTAQNYKYGNKDELTRDGSRLVKAAEDLWVNIDGQVLHAHELLVPRLDALMGPLGEGSAH